MKLLVILSIISLSSYGQCLSELPLLTKKLRKEIIVSLPCNEINFERFEGCSVVYEIDSASVDHIAKAIGDSTMEWLYDKNVTVKNFIRCDSCVIEELFHLKGVKKKLFLWMGIITKSETLSQGQIIFRLYKAAVNNK